MSKLKTYWFSRPECVYYYVKEIQGDACICDVYETCHPNYGTGVVQEWLYAVDFDGLEQVTAEELERALHIRENLDAPSDVVYVGEKEQS